MEGERDATETKPRTSGEPDAGDSGAAGSAWSKWNERRKDRLGTLSRATDRLLDLVSGAAGEESGVARKLRQIKVQAPAVLHQLKEQAAPVLRQLMTSAPAAVEQIRQALTPHPPRGGKPAATAAGAEPVPAASTAADRPPRPI